MARHRKRNGWHSWQRDAKDKLMVGCSMMGNLMKGELVLRESSLRKRKLSGYGLKMGSYVQKSRGSRQRNSQQRSLQLGEVQPQPVCRYAALFAEFMEASSGKEHAPDSVF